MIKNCPICDNPLRDGDNVVAIMATKFKMIPSDVSFAIEHPRKLIEIVHDECFDSAEYNDDQEDE
jgi:hypothetical protein